MSKGLYIHIPFCKYICSYCDFGKKYIKNQPVDQYVQALVQELEMYSPFTDVNSIYIGGGTPSSLTEDQLQIIFDKLEQLIDFSKIVEFTFELNPDDVNQKFLKFLKRNNINRLSIGAQTLNDSILTQLHREHTADDVRSAVQIGCQLFDNVSVDFMFNLPNQTKADIIESLEFISKSEINHVSYYGLIFEDHTILSTEDHKYWSEDYESEIYNFIQTELNNCGFNQYEISNYTRGAHQSIHNIHYWDRDPYYGIGLSSSGQLDNHRYTNTYSLREYIGKVSSNQFPIRSEEQLTAADVEFETIMLSLRYHTYVTVTEDVLNFIKGEVFLQDKFDIDGYKIRLKPEFYYISNQIILDIIERIEC